MDFKRDHKPLILASKSPRRIELLRSAGLDPMVMESNFKEPERTNELPDEYAGQLSYCKAYNVALKMTDYHVLGADTIVVSGDEILGKPRSKEDAEIMMVKLSGKTHKVITGYSLISPGMEKITTLSSVTKVKFRRLAHREIIWYINTDEPYDKAGGYGIQGKAASFVESVEGSYSNVVGLPLSEVIELMQRERIID